MSIQYGVRYICLSCQRSQRWGNNTGQKNKIIEKIKKQYKECTIFLNKNRSLPAVIRRHWVIVFYLEVPSAPHIHHPLSRDGSRMLSHQVFSLLTGPDQCRLCQSLSWTSWPLIKEGISPTHLRDVLSCHTCRLGDLEAFFGNTCFSGLIYCSSWTHTVSTSSKVGWCYLRFHVYTL